MTVQQGKTAGTQSGHGTNNEELTAREQFVYDSNLTVQVEEEVVRNC